MFSSSLAQSLLGENVCVVQGKSAIMAYWQRALEVNRGFLFTL